ncbi:Lrp/AsnC ligand binding domain-containing protein [Aquincola sp. S2]|uniref:Lrp/AsnC ligand binding domain-containing protein n=2 Tax=Pseudaquabacterium terrae TaxID=2732868 RepID=A0ABX2ENQ1_9BURK|nr:Lrp/AsnC ligand binding domain-containing protein [Aquabacterium terrae]
MNTSARSTTSHTSRPLPPPLADPQPRPLPPVDAIDAQLLRLLQDDGRIAITRLGEVVGLSPAATHDRVARLKREGYILGYEAVLNAEKLTSGLLVFAEISVNDPAPGIGRALKAAMQVRHEVIECHEVDGRFDYLLKTRVADMYAYRDFVASVVWKLPGVREVRTYAVIDEIKNTSRIPV